MRQHTTLQTTQHTTHYAPNYTRDNTLRSKLHNIRHTTLQITHETTHYAPNYTLHSELHTRQHTTLITTCETTLSDLCVRTDFIFLQEHWITEEQLGELGLITENVSYAGVSGFDNSVILEGRPYGGCAILW